MQKQSLYKRTCGRAIAEASPSSTRVQESNNSLFLGWYITKKQGKYIQIRGKATDVIPAILEKLHRAKDFVLSQNCRIKFIGVPIYLVALYNDVKGHRNPTVFLDADKEV